MVQTKRWVPLFCAFIGARVAEITQLRKEDLRQVDGMWVARITPNAGTVKSSGYTVKIEAFEAFIGYDDAIRVTTADVGRRAWHLSTAHRLAPATVNL